MEGGENGFEGEYSFPRAQREKTKKEGWGHSRIRGFERKHAGCGKLSYAPGRALKKPKGEVIRTEEVRRLMSGFGERFRSYTKIRGGETRL